MDACLQNYAQHRNSRLLPPALMGLTGQAALGMLPKLLDLEPAAFQAALHRLLMPLPSGIVAAYYNDIGKHACLYTVRRAA